MEFDGEFLKNQIFGDSLFTSDLFPNRSMGTPNKVRPMTLLPNGDYIIRIDAPKSARAEIVPEFGDPLPEGYQPWQDKAIVGKRDDNGVFSFLLPFDRRKTGIRTIDLYLDGSYVVWPYLPVCWANDHHVNFVEVPDPDQDFCYIKKVPHGAVSCEMFWSDATGQYERCFVYTPPGYMNGNDSYPVLYMWHGGGENETGWFTLGRANYIFDNLIAEGTEPFIAVSVGNKLRYDYEDGRRANQVDGCSEKVLINECIPHIEKTFRVKKDKFSRALCGLSLGALMGCDCALRYPDTFGSAGFFTSILEHESYTNDLGRPWEEALRYPQKFADTFRVFFCSAAESEDHFPFWKNDERLMREAGLEELMPGYVREVHEKRFTRWCSWRLGLRNFAGIMFKKD